MKKIKFTKMVASGNDFVVVENLTANLSALARKLCERRFGIGADGLLILGPSSKADLRMRIFNADGSEAKMCGNGSRCVAYLLAKKKSSIETGAGIIEARVDHDRVRVKLTDPRGIKLGLALRVGSRVIRADFINTGVPHAVIFVEGLEALDLGSIGALVRRHPRFYPQGANADFVEVLGSRRIKIRTYERGVEAETPACGTGSAASALIFSLKSGCANMVEVLTESGELLKVYFKRKGLLFSDVWLEGKAKIVYKGEYLCSGAR